MTRNARAIKDVRVTPRQHPRYVQIAQAIEKQIHDDQMPAGSQLPSEPQLAKLFGVNHLTIRRALARLQEHGQVLRQRGRGTFIANDPGAGATTCILHVGVLEGHAAESQFTPLHSAAQAQGCRLLALAPESKKEPPTAAWRIKLRDYLADADCVVVSSEYHAEVSQAMVRQSKPTVVIGNHKTREPQVPPAAVEILFDRQRGVQWLTEHLAAQGHRRMALVVQPGAAEYIHDGRLRDPYWSHEFRECNTGFQAALAVAGLNPDESPVMPLDIRDLSSSAHQASSWLSSGHDRPTAFVCDMDYRALAFYRAAAALNLSIPHDVSIAGLGDTPWASSWIPSLTSVDLGHEEMANLAIQMCLHPPASSPVSLHVRPKLVLRESTGTPSSVRQR